MVGPRFSYVDEHPGEEARAAGAAGFIAKPYHYQEFLAEIARVLGDEPQARP